MSQMGKSYSCRKTLRLKENNQIKEERDKLLNEYLNASEKRKKQIKKELVKMGRCLDTCKLGECTSKEDMRAVIEQLLERKLMQEYPTASKKRKEKIQKELVKIAMYLEKRKDQQKSEEDIRAVVTEKLNKPKLKF